MDSTLPEEVWTTSEDCSTDCKNLKSRFQFPLQRFKASFWEAERKEAYIGCNPQSWNAAKSTKDRKFLGKKPWFPLKVLEVSSKHTKSTALNRPEVNISSTKCNGKSSIIDGRNRSPIFQKKKWFFKESKWKPKIPLP